MSRTYKASKRVLSHSLRIDHFRETKQPPLFLMTATATAIAAASAPTSMLSAIVDALPKGLIVVSTNQAIIYWNQNARRLCQRLSETQRYATELPIVIADLCEQVLELDSLTNEPIVLDYQTPNHASFRLMAYWLDRNISDRADTSFKQRAHILVMIEDRDEVLQQDMQVEQKKFQLTNREAEVWLLLKQEYSYQAIATTLHISLNTVKTHIRNIHAKRHPHQSFPA